MDNAQCCEFSILPLDNLVPLSLVCKINWLLLSTNNYKINSPSINEHLVGISRRNQTHRIARNQLISDQTRWNHKSQLRKSQLMSKFPKKHKSQNHINGFDLLEWCQRVFEMGPENPVENPITLPALRTHLNKKTKIYAYVLYSYLNQ